MVLDDAIRFFIWYGRPRHDGEQRLFIVLREHQLVARQAVVVVIVKEVVLPQRRDLEVSKEAGLVGITLQIVSQGSDHQRKRRHALLPVNQKHARNTRGRALGLGDIKHRPHEVRYAITTRSHDVIPKNLALFYAPRINSLVHGNDELHLRHAHKVEQICLGCFHLRNPPCLVYAVCSQSSTERRALKTRASKRRSNRDAHITRFYNVGKR